MFEFTDMYYLCKQLKKDNECVAEPPKELGPHAPIVVLTDLR